MTRLFPLLIALVIVTSPAASRADEKIDVGSTIPHSLAFRDQNGHEQSFEGLKGKKGLTLMFVRSAEWCPYCKAQLIDFGRHADEFSKLGYPVVSISYDAVDKLKAFADQNPSGLTLLSDPRSDSIRAFGILNTSVAKGTMAYGTPYPGVYVIGADKVVKARFFKEGIADRYKAQDVIAAIKEMEKPPEPEPAPEPTTAAVEEPVAPPAVTETVPAPVGEPSPVAMPVETAPSAVELPPVEADVPDMSPAVQPADAGMPVMPEAMPSVDPVPAPMPEAVTKPTPAPSGFGAEDEAMPGGFVEETPPQVGEPSDTGF